MKVMVQYIMSNVWYQSKLKVNTKCLSTKKNIKWYDLLECYYYTKEGWCSLVYLPASFLKVHQKCDKQKKCKNCPSLFLCAGAYTNPCIKSLHLPECEPENNIGVNLKLFLKHYVKYCKNGFRDLFVGFNDFLTYK